MELAVAFYISVYSLAALAGGILAWAENVPSVTLLTAPIAIALLFLNERNRIVRLDGGWVALAGFAAFAFPALEFFRGDEEFRLLSGAHLLTILQWVLLAYHKTAHQYWWICALSCLQVAIAAVLTTSPVFGIFILIYMFWALWTLSLFTLLLARLKFGMNDQALARKSGWQWPSLTRTAGDSAVGKPPLVASLADQSGGRESPRFRVPSEFRGTFQCEPRETDLNWRFVFGISGMSTVALMLGLILFLLTPRVWIGAVNPLRDENGFGGRKRNITGFSEQVRLNDFGRILESSAPVMELKLYDNTTNVQLSLHEALRQIGQEEVLLRGAALAVYDRGVWIPFETRYTKDIPPGPSLFNPQAVPLIRQEIRLEPTGASTLFTLGHPLYVKVGASEQKARRQIHTRAVSLPARVSMANGAAKYTVWSVKRDAWKPDQNYRVQRSELSSTYSVCPPNLRTLIEHTRLFLEPLKQKAGPNPPSQARIAQALLTYLRESGKFHYSLDRTVVDPAIDPIEDFLVNRKYGHCQYFAAALGLMLRVEGIPSCVITGFKGGIEDPNRQVIEVQQRHAHAWVEAYLDGDWVTLDPTPESEREEMIAAVGDRMRFWHQLTSFATTLWNDYVINLSFSKQQQDLYGPAQELLQSIAGQTKDVSSIWNSLAITIGEFWSQPQRWFSWQGGLIAFVLMLLLTGCYQIVRSIRDLFRKFWNQDTLTQRECLRVEFHLRYLALLKTLGLAPQPTQTQREFAMQVTDEWSKLHLPERLRPLATEVAQAYDGIRFGGQPLTVGEGARLLQAVSQLEAEIRPPARNTLDGTRQTHPPA